MRIISLLVLALIIGCQHTPPVTVDVPIQRDAPGKMVLSVLEVEIPDGLPAEAVTLNSVRLVTRGVLYDREEVVAVRKETDKTFQVIIYTSNPPDVARRLREAFKSAKIVEKGVAV